MAPTAKATKATAPTSEAPAPEAAAKKKRTVYGVGEKYIPTDGPFAGMEFHSRETYDLAIRSNYAEYEARIFIPGAILGGVPADPEIRANWLRTRLHMTEEALAISLAKAARKSPEYADMPDGLSVTEVLDRVDADKLDKLDRLTTEMAAVKNLSQFKRDEQGRLYIEGRQLKAGFKEAANTAFASDRWGATQKGTRAYLAERVFVVEDRVYLMKPMPGYTGDDPTAPLVYLTAPEKENSEGIVHITDKLGNPVSAFSIKEQVIGAVLVFHYRAHNDILDPGQWLEILELGQDQGLGASRSQSFGKYNVLYFKKITKNAKRRIAFIDETFGAVAAPALEDDDTGPLAGVNVAHPEEARGRLVRSGS